MASETIDLPHFIVTLVEGAYRTLLQATDGLTDAQLYAQPSPQTNSIAWLMWHLSRWRDAVSASVSGEPQLWEQDGWATRYGIPASRTGLGDTLEQVAAFRVERTLLFGYAEAAHQVTIARIARLTPEQLQQPVLVHTGEHRPAWRALASICSDSAQHSGQIAYLRGLFSGYGWRG